MNIVPENSFNLISGETQEEKASNLTKLVEFLSSIVEMDLTHINSNYSYLHSIKIYS